MFIQNTHASIPINLIGYEFDKHGLSLAEVDGFEWETAVIREDTRKQYAEQCFEITGYIGNPPICSAGFAWSRTRL